MSAVNVQLVKIKKKIEKSCWAWLPQQRAGWLVCRSLAGVTLRSNLGFVKGRPGGAGVALAAVVSSGSIWFLGY